MGNFVQVVESSWIIINHRVQKYKSSSSLSSSQHLRCLVSYQSPAQNADANMRSFSPVQQCFYRSSASWRSRHISIVAVFGKDLKRIIHPHVSMFDVHFTVKPSGTRDPNSRRPRLKDWGSNFSQGSTGGCFFCLLWNEHVHQIEKEALNCYIPEMWRMDTPNVFLMKLLGNFWGVSSYQISGGRSPCLWNLFEYGAKVLLEILGSGWWL